MMRSPTPIDPIDLDDLNRQVRDLWRREPRASGDQREELLFRLQDLRAGLEHLRRLHRDRILDDQELQHATDDVALELAQLRVHWA